MGKEEEMSLIKDIIASNKEAIVDSIFDDELQEKVVKALNDNIDIPFLTESTEEKLINAVYDSIEDVIKATIIEKL
tara:strand:- start:69 stop:296 length:228 start_codon:yes stop_codon:yes gene_type:complete